MSLNKLTIIPTQNIKILRKIQRTEERNVKKTKSVGLGLITIIAVTLRVMLWFS
jgi:hypothetical protein